MPGIKALKARLSQTDFSNVTNKNGRGVGYGTGEGYQTGNNFFEDIGLVDVHNMDNLQNNASLILITAPPLDNLPLGPRDNGSFISKARGPQYTGIYFTTPASTTTASPAEQDSIYHIQNLLKNYHQNMVDGKLLRCSSLCEGITGLPSFATKFTKTVENSLGSSYEIATNSALEAPAPLTLSFNESSDIDAFNTFFTIWKYQEAVVNGTLTPHESHVLNGIINYTFAIYLINFKPNGVTINSSYKFTNCSVRSVSADVLEFDQTQTEQKKTKVEIAVGERTINREEIFKELAEMGILPATKFRYTAKTQQLLRIGAEKDTPFTKTERSNIRAINKQTGSYYKIEETYNIQLKV